MKKDLYSFGAIDNADYNPSSTTTQSAFHGTTLSMIQFPTKDNPGTVREPIVIDPQNKTRSSMPDFYMTVPVVRLKPTLDN